MTASGHRLVLRSAVSSGRRPKVWHSELTDQVTWWRSAIRTRPAHSSAVSAPTRVPDRAKPITKGMASDAEGQHREQPVDPPDVPVPQHVGRVAGGVGGVRDEEPADVGERQPPQEGQAVVAVAVGEWGSPAWSLYMWWRRWVATQLVNEPSTAIEPITARMIRRARCGREAAVGEQPVEPDGDPEAGEDVEDESDARGRRG